MAAKSLFRLGLSFLLLAAAVYSSAGYWLDTRIFTPLDHPVSLESAHLKSPPFQINLRETYYPSLELDPNANDWNRDNPCKAELVFNSRWRVYRLDPDQTRELWATYQLGQLPYVLDAFLASRGRYELEWDIPAPAPCLDSRHPRLVVHTYSEGYRDAIALIQLFCVFWGGTALVLIVVAIKRSSLNLLAGGPPPRIFPDMILRNVVPTARHAPLQPIHDPPHWGLLCGAVLWILIFIFMIFEPDTRRGFFVSLENPEVLVLDSNGNGEPLSVYVRAPGIFFVNGEEVAKRGLRGKVLEHQQIPWTIYFEADPDITFGDAVYAMDVIQGCGAKLIWITPMMRQEWKLKTQHSSRKP